MWKNNFWILTTYIFIFMRKDQNNSWISLTNFKGKPGSKYRLTENNWCMSVFRPKSYNENFIKLLCNSLFHVKCLKITFEFHHQIFKLNLAQTIICLKIFLNPSSDQNLQMKISSNYDVTHWILLSNFQV